MVDQGGVEEGPPLSNPLCCATLRAPLRLLDLKVVVSSFRQPHPALEASENKDLLLQRKK